MIFYALELLFVLAWLVACLFAYRVLIASPWFARLVQSTPIQSKLADAEATLDLASTAKRAKRIRSITSRESL